MRDLLALIALFAIVTALASALGAPNLGTAATFGQLAFVALLVALLVRPRGRGRGRAQPVDARGRRG